MNAADRVRIMLASGKLTIRVKRSDTRQMPNTVQWIQTGSDSRLCPRPESK
jgi:hypothetical protein